MKKRLTYVEFDIESFIVAKKVESVFFFEYGGSATRFSRWP